MKKKNFLYFAIVYFVISNFLNISIATEQKKNQINYKNFGIIISGPSGVGKTTIINDLVKLHNKTLNLSISVTTRKPRYNEKNGKDYYFVDEEKFKELAQKDEFIEYTYNYGNYYGSPRRNYIESINNNKDVVFALSCEGAKKVKKQKKMDFVTIFIAPPSEEELYKRLSNRKTENQQQIKTRFESAKNELKYAKDYDYVVYNIDLQNTVKQIEAIYLAEQKKREINIR